MRILSILALTLPILGMTSTIFAENSAPCLRDAQKKVSRLSFNLDFAVQRRTDLTEQRFIKIDNAYRALRKFLTSDALKKCLRTHPRQGKQFSTWRRKHIDPAMASALAEQNQTCTVHGEYVISQAKAKVAQAFASGHPKQGVALANQLAKTLKNRRLLSSCIPLDEVRKELLTNYVPQVRADAAIPKIISNMSAAYFSATKTYQRALSALTTSGKSMRAAPITLTTKLGYRAYQNTIAKCLESGRALQNLGAKSDLALGETDTAVTLQSAFARCEQMHGNTQLRAKVIAHNKRHEQVTRKKWERINLKGWGMTKLYRERGKPLSVARRGKTIIWSYASGPAKVTHIPCTGYLFSQRGKLMGQVKSRCNRPGELTTSHR